MDLGNLDILTLGIKTAIKKRNQDRTNVAAAIMAVIGLPELSEIAVSYIFGPRKTVPLAIADALTDLREFRYPIPNGEHELWMYSINEECDYFSMRIQCSKCSNMESIVLSDLLNFLVCGYSKYIVMDIWNINNACKRHSNKKIDASAFIDAYYDFLLTRPA